MYVVVTCAITLDLSYFVGAVISIPFFPWWPERMSNALVRLLALSLPSLGWVSSALFVSSSLVFYPALPLNGWQLLDILFTPSSLTTA